MQLRRDNGPDMIYFYNKSKDFYELTNFFDDGCAIVVDNKRYRTSEHYFQSQAFLDDPKVQSLIEQAPNARAVYEIAQKHKKDTDWSKRRDRVMLKALIAKFSEQTKQAKLLSTGTALLVEDSPYDQFWGVGAKGTGENKLGLMLMAVRDEYQNRLGYVDEDAVWERYQDLKKVYRHVDYGKPDPRRQTPKSASGRVVASIRSAGYNSIAAVTAVPDINPKRPNVIKVQFHNANDAADFARFASGAFCSGGTVILGAQRSPIVFRNLGVQTHGRTHKYTMYDALCYEAKHIAANVASAPVQKVHNAVLIMKTNDEHFLTVKLRKKRGFGMSTQGGSGFYYSFPGGQVDLGEVPKDAAIRECLEETGISVNARDVKEITASIPSHCKARNTTYFECAYPGNHNQLSRELSRRISNNKWQHSEVEKPCVHSPQQFKTRDADVKNLQIMQHLLGVSQPTPSVTKVSVLKQNHPACDRVIKKINENVHVCALRIYSSPDKDSWKPDVIKVEFQNQADAKKFSAFAKGAPRSGNVVTLGPNRAPHVFKNLGVPTHGYTNQYPMYDAVCHETKQARQAGISEHQQLKK